MAFLKHVSELLEENGDASGPSPVYYGSGYLPSADYWRLGAIFGVIFFAAFLIIGVPWMLLIR